MKTPINAKQPINFKTFLTSKISRLRDNLSKAPNDKIAHRLEEEIKKFTNFLNKLKK